MPGDAVGIAGWQRGGGSAGTPSPSLHTLKALAETSDPLGGPTSPRARAAGSLASFRRCFLFSPALLFYLEIFSNIHSKPPVKEYLQLLICHDHGCPGQLS